MSLLGLHFVSTLRLRIWGSQLRERLTLLPTKRSAQDTLGVHLVWCFDCSVDHSHMTYFNVLIIHENIFFISHRTDVLPG